MSREIKPKTLLAGGAILVVVLLAVIVTLFVQNHNLKKDPKAEAKATSQRVLSEVGQIYILPTDEDPTVAQIQDKTKLGNQQFFTKAQDGDYVLVYTKNKLALVYREKTRQLVNVGPVNFNTPTTSTDTSSKASTPTGTTATTPKR